MGRTEEGGEDGLGGCDKCGEDDDDGKCDSVKKEEV